MYLIFRNRLHSRVLWKSVSFLGMHTHKPFNYPKEAVSQEENLSSSSIQ